MKCIKTKPNKFLVGIPCGPIEHMEASWAEDWINIYDNGGIGFDGRRKPSKEEKEDIRKRIIKLQSLLKSRLSDLDKAMELMG